jgi:hypothetical protein
LTAIILPGFIFGMFLTSSLDTNTPSANKTLFILFSGALYIFTSWIATGSRERNPSYLIFIATMIGAILLFCLYKMLLESSLSVKQGLLYATLTGAISSILPMVGIYYDTKIENDWIKWSCLFSVFPVWQPLFTLTVLRTKATANNSFPKAGLKEVNETV